MPRNINRYRPAPYATLLDNINRASKRECYFVANASITSGFRFGVIEGTSASAERARAFGEALKKRTTSSTNDLEATNYALAKRAQKAILASYKAKKKELGRNIEPYRVGWGPNDRHAGGRMELALGDENAIRATAHEIGLANEVFLDSIAAQWYRLNWGAAPASTPSPKQYPLKFGGVVFDSVGAGETGPSRPFLLPRGVFNSRGQFFIPGSGRGFSAALREGGFVNPTPRRTKGIQGWNYLDAGFASISRNFGPAYEQLYDKWYKLALRDIPQGPFSRTKMTPPPPVKFRKISPL